MEAYIAKSKIVNTLRWISIPFVFIVSLLVITGVLNFLWRYINPGGLYDDFIMIVASGLGSFYSINLSFTVAPKQTLNVLYSICFAASFFYGMVFWNSMLKREYVDLWGLIGNIVGLAISFYILKKEINN